MGGFFGVGGGWIITPALNILGLPMPYAVGTGLGYVFGMALVSGWQHRRHGNMEVRLGFGLGVPMVAGVEIGKTVVGRLERLGQADSVIRWIYIAFLLGLGSAMLWEYWRAARRGPAPERESVRRRPPLFLRLGWPPRIHLPASGVRISLWAMLGAGLFTGVLAGVLGVGGGFLLMPMMAYLMGAPTLVAVGTSLLCLLIASPFAVLVYSGAPAFVVQTVHHSGISGLFDLGTAWPAFLSTLHTAGRVEYGAAGLMIAGALVGSPLGVAAGERVRGRILRLLYAVMIMLGGISVALKQAGLDAGAEILIFGVAGGMSLLILVLMARALWRAREHSAGEG